MSNNESNRPFADQVLEYAGVQVGDIWSDDRTQTDLKVLYIRNTDDPYPVLTTDASHQNAFVNEQYITEMCTLVERGGQVVHQLPVRALGRVGAEFPVRELALQDD